MTKHFFPPAASRRLILGGGLAAMAQACLPRQASAALGGRSLAFENLHTGERLTATYWESGHYLLDAAQQIGWVLRDHRANSSHVMDPNLLDLLHALGQRLETHRPIQVISGYRAPKTNALLHKLSEGVASGSLHMDGKAIDIRIAGVDLKTLRDAARSLGLGGVGFYASSNFVHVDTGRTRTW